MGTLSDKEGNSISYNKSNFYTLILKRNYSSTPEGISITIESHPNHPG